jgi:Subtilase family
MQQKNRTLWRGLAALAAAVCVLVSASADSFGQAAAQNEPPSSNAARIVEMPPLIADLFRSTPGVPAPLIESVTNNGPSITPAGPANPPLPGSSAPAVSVSGDFVPDEVVATLQGDGAAAQQIAADLGLQVRSARSSALFGTTTVRFGIPDGRPVGAVLALLAQDGRVRNSGANHIYTVQQGAPVKSFAFASIAFDTKDADGSGIRIGVIDTARDVSHPAFEGLSVIDGNLLPDTPVNDTDHGTEIIGLIAGRNVFAGLAPGATILHARAFDVFKPGGKATSTAVALVDALAWAAENGAQIINMSFAGPRNQLLEERCLEVKKLGILLVAAAGNEGPTAPPAFPAAIKGVIAVTATDERNQRMGQANVGTYVQMAAPGVRVPVPIPGGGFDMKDGTSQATAIYTAALANLMRRLPGKSAAEVNKLLNSTALDLGEKGRDIEFGFGLVNMKAALAVK